MKCQESDEGVVHSSCELFTGDLEINIFTGDLEIKILNNNKVQR